jgi:hypothetical protein
MSTPNDAAVAAAQNIENVYRKSGAGAAADALRKDYESSLTADSQAVLNAERARIQQDNPNILPALALEWGKPQTNGDNLSQKDLAMYSTMGANANPNTAGGADARFAGDMAQQLAHDYSTLTADNIFTHAITSSDIDRAQTNYEQTRASSSITAALLGKGTDGVPLVQRIGGVNDITPDMLQTALDQDSQQHFMSQDQRAQIQNLHDHWSDGTLDNGMWNSDTEGFNQASLNAYAKTNHIQPTDATPPAAPAPQPAPEVAAPAAAPPPKDTTIAVRSGMGDWDVAAQAMGLDDGTGTLEHQRAAIRASLQQHPDALQPLLALMKQLEAIHPRLTTTDSFKFTGTGKDVKLEPDTPAQPAPAQPS